MGTNMSNKVWVVTCSELGWDCVVAAYDYDRVSEETLRKRYPIEEYYHITDLRLETSVDENLD